MYRTENLNPETQRRVAPDVFDLMWEIKHLWKRFSVQEQLQVFSRLDDWDTWAPFARFIQFITLISTLCRSIASAVCKVKSSKAYWSQHKGPAQRCFSAKERALLLPEPRRLLWPFEWKHIGAWTAACMETYLQTEHQSIGLVWFPHVSINEAKTTYIC